MFVTTKASRYPPLPLPAPCDGYPYALQVPASIGEELGVERLRWVLAQALLAKASYVFMANDHTAVIPENLQCFLKSIDPSNHHMGRALAQKQEKARKFSTAARRATSLETNPRIGGKALGDSTM